MSDTPHYIALPLCTAPTIQICYNFQIQKRIVYAETILGNMIAIKIQFIIEVKKMLKRLELATISKFKKE